MPVISRLSYDMSSLTLTCVSTGGPATFVHWRNYSKDLDLIDMNYRHSQLIVNTANSTYHNKVQFTISQITGRYSCSVQNARGSSMSDQYIELRG